MINNDNPELQRNYFIALSAVVALGIIFTTMYYLPHTTPPRPPRIKPPKKATDHLKKHAREKIPLIPSENSYCPKQQLLKEQLLKEIVQPLKLADINEKKEPALKIETTPIQKSPAHNTPTEKKIAMMKSICLNDSDKESSEDDTNYQEELDGSAKLKDGQKTPEWVMIDQANTTGESSTLKIFSNFQFQLARLTSYLPAMTEYAPSKNDR